MSHFHSLRVAQVAAETRDAIVVTFDVPPESIEAFHYLQGQHLTLRAQVGGEDLRRSYSICSSAQEQTLRIAIKRVSDGVFSNWATETFKPGTVIECLAPAGHFHVPLEPGLRRHHIAFAAGSGITPVLSIIKTTLEAEPLSRFTLIYGNRASSSVIFKEELEDLKDRYLSRFNLIFVLSRESQDIELFNGRIDRTKCDAILERWLRPQDIDVAYLCGPQSMIDDVYQSLQAHGVPKSQIKLELFAAGLDKTPKVRVPVATQGADDCQVTVIRDGRTQTFGLRRNQHTLLDAALENGIELPYACKGGVCATCRCKLVSGEVDMDTNFALEDYEVARGFILPCQSFPVTERLTLDFDQET